MKIKIISILVLFGIILFSLHTVDKNTKEQISICDKSVQVMGNVKTQPEILEAPRNDSMIADIYYYCSCTKCTGKSPSSPSRGITASGKLAREKHTIAMDKRFPFGTLVEIDGTVYEVEDRGQLIQGNKIDIYTPSHEEALRRGHRTCEIKIIRWGQGEEKCK